MPKIQTHKATAKRFKIIARGKLLRLRAGRSHFRRKKSKRVRRSLDKYVAADRADRSRVRRLLGSRAPKQRSP